MVLLFPALLLVLSAMLIGPVVWHWGRREIVRLQSQSRWDAWCANSQYVAGDGDPCGWLKIPSCGIDTIVLSGGSKANLAKSVCMEIVGRGGRKSEGGNQRLAGEWCLRVISGHRDTHFRKLRHISEGDGLELLQADGTVLQYSVVEVDTIASGKLDEYISGQNHPGWIALLTCYPFRYIGSAPERYVVWCEPVW